MEKCGRPAGMNCGHIYDPVIEQNCLARQERVLVPLRGEPDYQDDDVDLGAEAFPRLVA